MGCEAGTAEWLAQVVEEVVDPGQRIIDPHHHLWPSGGRRSEPYGLDELHRDTGDGHRVEAIVFVECRAAYRASGPEHLQPVGETEFAADQAAASATRTGQAEIKGVVGYVDLRLGARVDEVLEAHLAAGGDRFKGVRNSGARNPDPDALYIADRRPEGLYRDEAFRTGVARLGERGLTFDAWHFHHQNRDFLDVAQAVPGTTMVLNHFGTPLGVGQFAGRRDEVFEQWKDDIAVIARCPNVVAKIGGLATPFNGFGWHERDRPATSDEIVTAQARYYHHTIECFGPDRCMFESDFPVNRVSLSYRTLWNALKKIAASYSRAERDAMFWGTAERIYRLK